MADFSIISRVGSGVGGGGTATPPPNPDEVVFAETAGERYADSTFRQTYGKFTITVTHPSGSNATWVNVWIESQHVPGLYDDLGRFDVGEVINVDRMIPPTAQTWHAKAISGKADAENPPGSAVMSNDLVVAGLGLPSSTSVTNAHFEANPFSDRERADGTHYAFIDKAQYTDSLSDPYAFFVRFTVQCVDVDGNPAPGTSAGSDDQGGDEVAWCGTQVVGDTLETFNLMFDYNLPGTIYHYMRFRCYVLNRLSTNTDDWKLANMSQLQSCWPGGADHFDVDFGQAPDFNVDASDVTGWGPGVYNDPDTGVPYVGSTVGKNLLIDASLKDSPLGALVSANWATSKWYSNTGSIIIEAAASGTRTAKLNAANTYTGLAQLVAVTPGKRYTIRAKLHTLDATVSCRVFTDYYNANLVNLGASAQVTRSVVATPTDTRVLSEVAPDDAAYMRVIFGWCPDVGTGSWYVQGCEVYETTETGDGLGTDANGKVTLPPSTFLNTEFEWDPAYGRFKMKALDLSKAFSFNSTEFEIVAGSFKVKGVDFTKGFNGFDVGSAAVPKITIAPGGTPVGWIGTSDGYSGAWFKRVMVGGSSPANAPLLADANGNVVAKTLLIYDAASPLGWIGNKDGYVGAWFKRIFIGGTSPADAKIIADAAGNVQISGSLIVGPVAAAGSVPATGITAGSLRADVIYGGTINVSQLLAGTVNVASDSTAIIVNSVGGSKMKLELSPYSVILKNFTSNPVVSISSSGGIGMVQAVNTADNGLITMIANLAGFGGGPQLQINGVNVVKARYSVRPVDLAGVISLLVYHGLSA